MCMEKHGAMNALRSLFCRFFALVGLAALLFVGAEYLSELPFYIEKAILALCFGGIF